MAFQPQAFPSNCVICHAKLPPRVLKRRSSFPLLREEKRCAYLRSHSAHALRGDLVCTDRVSSYVRPFIFDNFRISSETAMLPFSPCRCSPRYVVFFGALPCNNLTVHFRQFQNIIRNGYAPILPVSLFPEVCSFFRSLVV
jgi:hypothetical protein